MDKPTVMLLSSVGVAGVCGWFQVFHELRSCHKRIARAKSFLGNLKRFYESDGRDQRAYEAMLLDAAVIQRDLGRLGLIDYKPVGVDHTKRYYQVTNLIHEMRTMMQIDELFSVMRLSAGPASTLQETLLIHIGALADEQKQARRNLWNPLVHVREGVLSIVSLPVAVLASLGVLSLPAQIVFRHSMIVRILSGIISLITIVSAIVSLIVGWTAFVRIVGTVYK